MTTKQIEKEYSKVWITNNPLLFAQSVLHFLDTHPSNDWDVSVTHTAGFLTITAKIIEV